MYCAAKQPLALRRELFEGVLPAASIPDQVERKVTLRAPLISDASMRFETGEFACVCVLNVF